MGSSADKAEIKRGDLFQRRHVRDPSTPNTMHLRRENADWDGFHCFGHPLQAKHEDDLRIGCWNVNSHPTYKHSAKFRDLKDFLLNNDLDIIGMNETNKYWNKFPVEARPWKLYKGIWESIHTNFNNNINDLTPCKHQPGGTSILSVNRSAHCIESSGRDPSGLGRWSWNIYRGKEGIRLAIVSAYIPVNPSGDEGISPNATYRQHKSYLSLKHRISEPKQALLDDLKIQLKEWRNTNIQIIVLMDANDQINNTLFTQYFDDMDMKEAILSLHPSQPAVATRTPGTNTIDGIWASRSIDITKAGYTPFHPTKAFDHRFAWIDVTRQSAFGHLMPPIKSYTTRRLKLQDPRITKRYTSVLRKHCIKHKLRERSTKLRNKCRQNVPLSATQAAELENIDELKIQGMVHAEKICRKLKTGKIPWSEHLQLLRDTNSFWEGLFRVKAMGKKIGMKQLEQRAKICKYTGPIHTLTLRHIKLKRKEVQHARYTFEKQARSQRQEFLHQLAQRRADGKNTTSAKQLKALVKREEVRKSWRRLKWVNNKITKGSITRVETNDAEGNIITLTQKEDIELACQSTCKQRLLLTQQTPFKCHPLNQHFNSFSDNSHVTAVLKGSYIPPPGTNKHAAILLKYFKQNTPVNNKGPISSIWTVSEYNNSWKKKRETTSSGDSTTHFGHFKAVIDDKYLMSMHTEIANIASMTGYSIRRWQRSLDVMIPKKDNSLLVNKLRLINLMEPCFNHQNSLYSRRFMHRAEQDKQMAIEQFGSRKHHSAITHAVNKVLTFDYLRLLRRPGIICANDAAQCYDRIVLLAAYLALRRMGMQPGPIASMFTTIQKMKHYTRTAFGTSDTYYGGYDWEQDPDGILQGNGMGPTIWAAVSTPILEMMRGEGFGITFIAPFSGDQETICGFAFVDDADLAEMADEDCSKIGLLLKTQQALDLWEGGISTTGGAIVPHKSDWVIADFEWNNAIWSYKSKDTRDKLYIKGEDGNKAPLKQLDTSTGRLTLGVHIAADGNWKDQVKYLRDKSKDWAEAIRAGHIQRKDAWTALNMTIMKSLEYCLPATTLSATQLDKIYSPAITRGLSASGVVRSLAREVCFGLQKYHGLGLRNPLHTQGIEHIKLLLNHGHRQTILGHLIRSCIELTKLEIGTGTDLFSNNYSSSGFLSTYSWIQHTWQFLWSHNISINELTPNIPLKRLNDCYIMTAMIKSRQLTQQQLTKANRCRLFLQVFCLSDIVSAGGTHILQNFYDGRQHPQRFSTFNIYPATGIPSSSDWRAWQTALRLTFDLHHPTSPLPKPLSTWTLDDQLWIWYYSPSDNRLYRRLHPKGTLFSIYSLHQPPQRRYSHRTSHKTFRSTTHTSFLPSDALRASTYIKQHNPTIFLESFDLASQPNQPLTSHTAITPPPTQLRTAFSLLPDTLRWCCATSQIPRDDGYSIAQAILHGKAIGVSDGSFKFQYGTAGFIIHSHLPHCSLVAALPCLGDDSDHDAYRSELTGLLGLLTALQVICEFHKISSGSITLGCDNDNALDRSFDENWLCDVSAQNWDLIRCIRHLASQLPITIKPQKIKGHNDDKFEWKALSIFEQLNVQCDEIAKLFWEDTHKPHSPILIPELPGEGWAVQIQGHKIVKDLDSTLHEFCSTPMILKKWSQHTSITTATSQLIHWEALGIAMKLVPRSRQIYVVKNTFHASSTGINMRRRGE